MRISKAYFTGIYLAACCATTMAIPVPRSNSSDDLRIADTVFVGQVTGRSVSDGLDDWRVELRVDRIVKSTPGVRVGQMIALELHGPVTTDLNDSSYGLFVLRCGNVPEHCHPVDGFAPGWPALKYPASVQVVEGGSDVEKAAISELVGFISSGDVQIEESSMAARSSLYGAVHARVAATDYLLASVGEPTNPIQRSSICAAKLRLGDPSCIAGLGRWIDSTDSELRAALHQVAFSLDGIAKPPASLVTSLKSWLKASDPILRRAAAYAMRDIATPEAVRPLLDAALSDPDKEVRYLAVTGLSEATHEGDVPSVELFNDNEAGYLSFWRVRKHRLEQSYK